MAAGSYAFGVIPARGGSKGLPGKNLRRLGALSLIGHAVTSAREASRLDRFIVSTDSAEIAEEARGNGAEVDAKVLGRIWLHSIKRIADWKRQGDMRERVDARRIGKPQGAQLFRDGAGHRIRLTHERCGNSRP